MPGKTGTGRHHQTNPRTFASKVVVCALAIFNGRGDHSVVPASQRIIRRSRIPSLFAPAMLSPAREPSINASASEGQTEHAAAAFVLSDVIPYRSHLVDCHERSRIYLGMVQNGDHCAWFADRTILVDRGHSRLPKIGPDQEPSIAVVAEETSYARLQSRQGY